MTGYSLYLVSGPSQREGMAYVPGSRWLSAQRGR